MRKLLSLLLILAMVSSLTACSTEDIENPASDNEEVVAAPVTNEEPVKEEAVEVVEVEAIITEPVTIEYWYCFTDAVEQYNIDKVAEFNDTIGKEMGITVNAVNQQDYSTVGQKLQASAVTGDTPEVVLMGVDQTPFVNDGVLLSLDSYIQRDAVDMTDFYDGFLAQSYYNGQVYSMPFLKSTAVMIYNKTLFDSVGLDATNMVTWDDLVTFSETLHDELGIYGVTTYSWPWILESYLLSFNSSFHTTNNTTNINSDPVKDFAQMFLDMKESGAAHLIPQAEYNNIYAEFASGQTAMIPMSTGAIVSLAGMGAKYGIEVGVAFMPKGDVDATVTGGGNLAITTMIGDAEKEAAWQFVKFMTNTDNSVAATVATGYLPTRKSVMSAPTLLDFVAAVPQMQIAFDQLENTKTPTNIGNEENRAISTAIENIWISDTDLGATLEEAESKINTLLSEAN